MPDFTPPPAGYDVHAEIMVDVPVEHGLLMENLLDLAHAPFTHVSTFARGWPVPDAVKFHAKRLLEGDWDPYPIEMSFQPPCMVVSLIGLAQPGMIMRGVKAAECERHLHQLHVCMPSKKGHTRLLYRMSLDFMPWLRFVPFIDRVWQKVRAGRGGVRCFCGVGWGGVGWGGVGYGEQGAWGWRVPGGRLERRRMPCRAKQAPISISTPPPSASIFIFEFGELITWVFWPTPNSS